LRISSVRLAFQGGGRGRGGYSRVHSIYSVLSIAGSVCLAWTLRHKYREVYDNRKLLPRTISGALWDGGGGRGCVSNIVHKECLSAECACNDSAIHRLHRASLCRDGTNYRVRGCRCSRRLCSFSSKPQERLSGTLPEWPAIHNAGRRRARDVEVSSSRESGFRGERWIHCGARMDVIFFRHERPIPLRRAALPVAFYAAVINKRILNRLTLRCCACDRYAHLNLLLLSMLKRIKFVVDVYVTRS